MNSQAGRSSSQGRRRRLARRPRPEPLEGRSLLSLAGAFDPTFGTGGAATVQFAGRGPRLRGTTRPSAGLAATPGGQIIAVGTTGFVQEFPGVGGRHRARPPWSNSTPPAGPTRASAPAG